MNQISSDLMAALPEILVLGMAMVILLLEVFLKRHRVVLYLVTQSTLMLAAIATLYTFSAGVGYAFNGMFVDDAFADTVKLMLYAGTSIILIYTRHYLTVRDMFRGEFYALVLFALAGMMVMVSGQHFLTLYIGLELLSLSLYALVAFDRDNPQATEAAMKYFVLGALASGMLLYGMSMLYGATGSLNLGEVNNALLEGVADHAVLVLGLVFVVAGLAFKLGAVPFQMWLPDVYQGASTPVTLLIGSVTKLAAFAFVIRLLVQGLYTLAVDWQQMLMVMAVLSIIIGNLSAIMQTNIKRMLAYSTIAHVGYLFIGMLSATMNGFISGLFYMVAYVIMSLAGFGIILLLSRKGFEADQLSDLKGLNQRNPWFAFMMLLTMFSMAGVPPTLGFYAKFSVLQAALQAGYVGLVIFAVLMAVTGAFYYLRVVWYMYFEDAQDHAPLLNHPEMYAVLSVNCLGLLLLGIMPQPLMEVCAQALLQSLQ